MKIICFFKGHKRDKKYTHSRTPWITRTQRGRTRWFIKCERCGYKVTYESPRARLISNELEYGFDGE